MLYYLSMFTVVLLFVFIILRYRLCLVYTKRHFFSLDIYVLYATKVYAIKKKKEKERKRGYNVTTEVLIL